ncbi:hypothetical protein ILUMI_22022, partial [Ignelater luminosus]
NDLKLDKVKYQQRIFEDRINDTINNAIAELKEFDPIIVSRVERDIAGHSVLIENATLEGFSNIYASRIRLGGLITWTLDLVIEIGRITSSTEHWKVDGPTVYGDGDA